MLAIEGVEYGKIRGAVRGPDPTTTVAAFRGEERFMRGFQRGLNGGVGHLLFVGFESAGVGFAGVPKEFPCGNVFGVADPDVEIRVDPGGGENSGSGRNFAGSGDGFAGRERAEILIGLDAAVKFAEEGTAGARIVFPGVFAVQEKTNGERLIALDGFAEVSHAIVKIGGGRFGFHAAVDKADEIGKMVIAEEAGNAVRSDLDLPRFVETIGVGRDAVGVAEKSDVEGTAEDTFIGTEPAEAFLGGDGKCLVGDGAFRGPQASRLGAKNALVILAGELQLFAGVFGTAIGATRERSAGIGDARDIGIADQWKDGVVERRGTDFDLAALGGITIHG